MKAWRDFLARPTALVLVAAAGAACADETGPPEPPARVEIVGTRVPRLDAETALPVQVIRRDAIERSGVQTTEELLARISANVGGQTVAMGLGSADTLGFSGASLRGLGSAETLVLLNGRRLANYAFTSTSGPGVDLNAIPLAAIDRVEVLKDGASALYGSDAIAGVINFVTRQDYGGADASLSYAWPRAGGGERARATFGAGTGTVETDGYNAFVVVDLQKGWHLRAIDRDFASTGYRPDLGITNLSPASFPANIPTRVNGRTVLVNPAAPECTPLTVPQGRACGFDPSKVIDLVPPSRQANLLGRGTLRVAPETDAYAEVSAAWSQILYNAAPTPVYQRQSAHNTPYNLPPSSPYYPTRLGFSGDLPVAYRTVELGPRQTEVTSTNTRVLVGLNSSRAGWDLDGAVALNDSRSTQRYLDGMVDELMMSQAIATGLVNPFGPSGPEGLALLQGAQIHGIARLARGTTQAADLRASRDLTTLAGGALGFATGIELRHEDLRDETTSLLDHDVVGGGSSPPKHGQRNVQAAFVELVAPFAKGIELQAAARLDHYSDFGTTVNPKLALRVQPAPDWLLRASVGRGFRAPSLPELYTQQSKAITELTDTPDPVRCPVTGLDSDCAPVVTMVSGGNPRLEPQTSVQADLGLVAIPRAGWQASVDLWAIRVKDIIGSLNPEDVLADIPRYEGRNIVRGPVDPAYPNLPGPMIGVVTVNENLGDWRVDGADLSLAMQPLATPYGRFGARLDGTWFHRARQEIFVGNEVDLIGRLVPRWKHALTLTADGGPWKATLSNLFRRGYVDENPLPDGSPRKVADYSVWDGQIAFAVSREIQLSLSVHNLFDRPPPTSNQSVLFQQGYDPIYADPLGRTWTLRLSAAWR